MFDRTLTERLEASTADHPYEHREFDVSRLTESVLANLTRIFNERRGSCETRDDYGMPDLNDVLGGGGTPATLANIIRAHARDLRAALERADGAPRRRSRQPARRRLPHLGDAEDEDEAARIAFDTIIAGGNRVRIRS